MDKKSLWTILNLIINFCAIVFVIYEIYNQTKSLAWASIAFAIYSTLMTLIISYELDSKPNNSKLLEQVNDIQNSIRETDKSVINLSKQILESQIELITNYEQFVDKITNMVYATKGRLFVLRVHTTGANVRDNKYFEATYNSIQNGNINLYRRLTMANDKSTIDLIKGVNEKIGGFEQVEIKIWNDKEFLSPFELILSDNEGLIIFKSDDGPPKMSIVVRNKQFLEQLFYVYDNFWKNSKSILLTPRGNLSKKEIEDINMKIEQRNKTT